MTPRTPAKTRDPERTRAAIVEAAQAEFVRGGFSGARTGEISKQAGVPQGLLYHYFENKLALFHEVISRVMRPYFRATAEMLEMGKPTPSLLADAIRLYFTFLRENPDVPRLLAWWHADVSRQEGAPMALIEKNQDPMSIGVQRIRESQDAGWIRAELDPATIIIMFIAVCVHWHESLPWTCHKMEMAESDDALEKMHDHFIDHVVDIYMRGVLTPSGLELYEREIS